MRLNFLVSLWFDYFFIKCFTAILDIILSFNAWRSLKWSQILRYLLKFFVAAFWVVLLSVSYSTSFQNPTGVVKFFSTLGGNWRDQSFFTYSVAIYLIPNLLAVLMFLLPPLRRSMERSNWRIISLLMWWAQARTRSFNSCLKEISFFDHINLQILFIVLSQSSMSEEACMKTCFLFLSKNILFSFSQIYEQDNVIA